MAIALAKCHNFFTRLFLIFSQDISADKNNYYHPIDNAIFHSLEQIEKQAIVDEIIEPGKLVRVRFHGSWWPAVCHPKISLKPGDIVYVIGRENITLLVEKLPQYSDFDG